MRRESDRLRSIRVGRRLTIALVLFGGCVDKPEKVELISQPMTIGPTPTTFGAAHGLPMHGPMMALRVNVVGDGYRRKLTKSHSGDSSRQSDICGRDGSVLRITAVLVGADGTRSTFDSTLTDVYGRESRSGIIYFLHHPREGAPRRRPIRVEVFASAPVTANEVQWITGDPSWGVWP